MKNSLLVAFFASMLMACGSSESATSQSLSGNIKNLGEGTALYLDYLTPAEIFTRDTAYTDAEGNYSFKFAIDQVGYYRLRINNQNFINLILEAGETPTINGDGINLMDTYTVEGSQGSLDLQAFNNAIRKDYMFQDSLKKYFQANQNDPNTFLDVQRKAMGSANQLIVYYNELVDKDPSTLLALAAVQQLDPEQHFSQYEKVHKALGEAMPNSPYFEIFNKKYEQIAMLNTGGDAPEITLNDPEGNPISLSSLKGNIVLVDFWASWCRPCRAENPNVVKAYNKYHEKGFEVFSVSLDGLPRQASPKEEWIAAIAKDGLVWKNHVSDLKGWQSSVVPMYGISGIPFTVLIDREGKVLAKNIRGQALEEKLAELFE